MYHNKLWYVRPAGGFRALRHGMGVNAHKNKDQRPKPQTAASVPCNGEILPPFYAAEKGA